MALRSVFADRLALALAHPQVGDEPGSQHQSDEERGRARRARPEAQIADEVQDAREVELLRDQVEHSAVSFVSRSITRERPTELEAFTSTASPGFRRCDTASAAPSASATCVTCTCPSSASSSG